jgi:hypothetical protein
MIQQISIEIIPEDKKIGLACTRDFLLPIATARSEKRSDNNEHSSAEFSSGPYSQLTTPLPHSGSLINGQDKTRTAR